MCIDVLGLIHVQYNVIILHYNIHVHHRKQLQNVLVSGQSNHAANPVLPKPHNMPCSLPIAVYFVFAFGIIFGYTTEVYVVAQQPHSKKV